MSNLVGIMAGIMWYKDLRTSTNASAFYVCTGLRRTEQGTFAYILCNTMSINHLTGYLK